MPIPLENRLRKQLHRDIARLQDEAMEILYTADSDLVFHGGTAIWRCYGGNRFSEDLDLYGKNIAGLAKNLPTVLAARGLETKKMKTTDSTLFGKVSDDRTEIRIEISSLTPAKPVAASYEKTDGHFMEILSLSARDLLLEKIGAYQNRRRVRDIYDILHLSSQVTVDSEIKKRAAELLADPPKPVDEPNLKAILFSGAVPTFAQMIEALRRRLR
ncbi:MAG: nucleotidyl transferase AbiEii/AbiGii toxin family protein [Candidatus Diapherotrites archaeon]|nr:nucleotidyl transferase AbiEii/AbiGii toxin family protein [Candidatus Diapherotrites archaeon]